MIGEKFILSLIASDNMLTIGIKDNRNEIKSIPCLIQKAPVDGAYY
jgi:hypothetical protein